MKLPSKINFLFLYFSLTLTRNSYSDRIKKSSFTQVSHNLFLSSLKIDFSGYMILKLIENYFILIQFILIKYSVLLILVLH